MCRRADVVLATQKHLFFLYLLKAFLNAYMPGTPQGFSGCRKGVSAGKEFPVCSETDLLRMTLLCPR